MGKKSAVYLALSDPRTWDSKGRELALVRRDIISSESGESNGCEELEILEESWCFRDSKSSQESRRPNN